MSLIPSRFNENSATDFHAYSVLRLGRGVSFSIQKMLRNLPAPVLDKLRCVRDQIAIRTFQPKVVEHVYGGIRLRVKIADKISAKWYDRDFDELPEITFLKEKRLRHGALVFDLGAHQAVIALLLARIVGESGRIIAVEASKYNFDLALENKSANNAVNLSIVRAAIGERSGLPVTFRGGINGSVSSFGETVLCTSIDTLTAEYGRPDVVMLDLEGYEGRALEGARETLKLGANWYVEVHAGCGLESFGGTSDQITRVFRDEGYTLYCQTDEHYRSQFHEMLTLPYGRFFMIAVKDPNS
jgi:FkbM family methyltransferase